MRKFCFLSAVVFTLLCSAAHAQDAPFIDAKELKEKWSGVTAKDIEAIRQKRILLTGKSLTLCLVKGLVALGHEDKAFAMEDEVKYDVEKNGGLSIIPGNAFDTSNFLHIMCTRHPYEKRVEEVDQLFRQEPWNFGGKVDIVMAFYADVDAKTFEAYSAKLEKLQADFPSTRIIYVTSSIYADGPKKDDNVHMNEFSDLIRKRYKGKAPVYDLGAVLTDDFRNGLLMLPEYSQDPTGVHPNTPLGSSMVAKGFLLAIKETLDWKGTPGADRSVNAGTTSAAPTSPAAAAESKESLSPDNPEYKAVRAILDKNGFASMKVEDHIIVEDGHVVRLAIQEFGFTVIPDEIGTLTKLKGLQCYGDRTLQNPYLKSISPAIGNCTEMEELLINSNDLTTLPVEIAKLTKLRTLSLADNQLKDLPPEVEAWAKKFDPKGLKDQHPSP